MKRFIASVILILSIYGLNAQTTYYVDAVLGDDGANGTSPSTPWKTVAKVSGFGHVSGNTVLFKRGQTFYGQLVPQAANMVFDAYGAGAKPIITGAVTLDAWADLGGGIFETSLASKPTVVVNGFTKFVNARTPDNGWWVIDGSTDYGATADIVANELAGRNFTGATAVIRKNRWIIDKDIISTHSGSTITFPYSYYAPFATNGFFVQDDIDCLTSYGEWFYDVGASKLKVYFGGGGTSALKASFVQDLVSITSTNGCTFRNIKFEYATRDIVRITGAQNIVFDACDFEYGYNGITPASGNCNGLQVKNCTIRNLNNNGMYLENAGSVHNFLLEYTNFARIGIIYGESGAGDGQATAINMGGSGVGGGPVESGMLRFNKFDTVGYVGIMGGGQNTTIMNNLINEYCYIKDDGGGIYGFNRVPNIQITGNIVINGATNSWGGTADQTTPSYGIYADNNSRYTNITNNTIINADRGIFLHDNEDVTARDNVVFGSRSAGIRIWNTASGYTTVRGLVVKKNIVVNTDFARILEVENLQDADDITLWGSIDSNWYQRPLSDGAKIYAGYGGGANYTIAGWYAYEGHDQHSISSPKTYSSAINGRDSIKIYYNASNTTLVQAIPGRWIDHTGAVYNNTVSISPYRSIVLFADGATSTPPPATQTGYVTWKTPLDADYELLPGYTTIGGARKTSIAAAGWGNGSIISNESIQEGESFEFATSYRSSHYSAFGLVSAYVDPMIGNPSVLFGMRGGNTTAPQTEDGMLPVEAGVDIYSAYQAATVDSPWYRFKFQNGTIKYGKSVDGGATYTDFYTSPIVPNATSYYLQFSGYDPLDQIRIAKKTGVATPVNQPPTASAGTDKTITLPVSTVLLTGTGSDPDGTVANTLWTKVSGPAGGTIQAASSLSTNVNALQAGTYVYRLTVTDNLGSLVSDDVQVTVLQSPVGVPPTANAGGNIAVMLPSTSTILYGNNSSAPSGATITAYAWTKISGPSGSILTTPSASITNLTNLIAGQYVYRLTVTASNGLTSSSDAVITVSATTTRKKRVFVRHN